MDTLNEIKGERIERKIGKIKQENVTRIQNAVKNLERKFPIRITYPKNYISEGKRFIIMGEEN